MRESRPYGSVRGALSNERPYRDSRRDCGSRPTLNPANGPRAVLPSRLFPRLAQPADFDKGRRATTLSDPRSSVVGSPVSYLAPRFDPDIFVSYSHGAPSGGRAPLRDWSRDLVGRLKEGLHALNTEFDGLSVWMDPDLDPTALLTDDLRAKASRCGVLIIVMSERYLESSWCKDEREWFKAQIRDRAGSDGRVFVIKAQRTDTKALARTSCWTSAATR